MPKNIIIVAINQIRQLKIINSRHASFLFIYFIAIIPLSFWHKIKWIVLNEFMLAAF